jgi:hypothetical protein
MKPRKFDLWGFFVSCKVFFDLLGINKLVFKKDKIISVALFGSSLWARNAIPRNRETNPNIIKEYI